MYKFLAMRDLPKPLPTVFAIGRPGDVRLCMTHARFSQLIGRRGTRDIKSSRVWVVPDNQFVRGKNLRWTSAVHSRGAK